MNKAEGIWDTLEMHCVAAGMDYEKDYLDFHKKGECVWAPLSKNAYEKLKEVFDTDFKDNMEAKAAEQSHATEMLEWIKK